MKVTIANTIRIESPTPAVVEWCRMNLVLANPEFAKRLRMGLWTGRTPKTISLYEIVGDSYVLPFGTIRELLPLLKNAEIRTGFADPEPVDYKADVGLYDYQKAAVGACIKKKYGILKSPAGSGKTQMGIALIAALGRRALWLTHTQDLLKQSYDRAAQYIDKSLLAVTTAGQTHIAKGITFATVQTLSKLDLTQYRDYWDTIIVDECFPAGTKIETIDGERSIEEIRTGDFVLTRNEKNNRLEYKEVEELQIRDLHRNLVQVVTKRGNKLLCTENHPIYTYDGYRKAGELNNGDAVCLLWKDLRYIGMEQKSAGIAEAWKSETSLLEEMCLPSWRRFFEGIQSQIWLGTDEAKQSNEEPRNPSESISNIARKRASASDSRRERTRDDRTSNESLDFLESIQSCWGICDPDQKMEGRVSESLQDRCGYPVTEISYRSRRLFAWLSEGSGSGCKEDPLLEWDRVESVTVYKPGDNGELERLCPENRVYNLSVKDNHNYFAEGFAVHNCHRVCKSSNAASLFYKVLNSLSARHKYGLSATVHRADGLIEAVYAMIGHEAYVVPDEAVEGKTMKVTVKAIGTDIGISRECLGTDGMINFAKTVNYLCADPCRNDLIAHAISSQVGHSCLILSDRLEHLKKLMELLPPELRRDAVMVSGDMVTKKAKQEREQAIEDMRQGKKHYLFATYSLCKEGLDIPRLDRLFLATPQKDYAVITQSIGRIARTFEGKEPPVCYDFVDDIYLMRKFWKQRCTTYRKNGCEIK